MNSSRKRALLPIVVLILAGLLFGAYRYFFRSEFRYAGTLEVTRVDVPARIASVVATVDVDEGQKVREGEKLASLACEEVRIASRLANENYDRAQKLKRLGSLAQEALDQVVSRKEESDARMSWCEIKAPVSGTILTRFVEPSEWVNPGAKILSLADMADIWAYIYVPQAVMSRLKTGTKVTGIVPELDNKVFQGVIRKINEEAEFTPKNVQTQAERTRLVFGVKIAFENREEILKPGMTIEVVLGEEEKSSKKPE